MKMILIKLDFGLYQAVELFLEFFDEFTSERPWFWCLKQEIIALIFEYSYLKFKFEKINLKYKIDADKVRCAKLFEAIET